MDINNMLNNYDGQFRDSVIAIDCTGRVLEECFKY